MGVVVFTLAPLVAGAQAKPLWLVGGESDAVTQLGELRDVEILPRHIVLLERDAPYLKVLTHDGKLVQSIGRKGGGPGEFQAPFGISYDGATRRLLVVDPLNTRITVYAVGDTLGAPRSMLFNATGARDACSMRGKLYALMRADTMVLELDERDGEFTARSSFGAQRTNHPHGAHPLVKTRASDGPLHCDAVSNTIVIGARILGEVHLIAADSRAHRLVTAPSFGGMTLTVDNNSMSMSTPPNGYDQIVDVIAWGTETLAVIEHLPPGRNIGSPTYRTAAITAAGMSTPSATRPWRPLALLPGGALCSTTDPAPAIALFPGRECPAR